MTDTEHRPTTASEARRLVHYGPRTHGDRVVTLDHRATPRQHVPGWELAVRGPSRPGELLTIRVYSGMIPLHVLGGNVAVILGSGWGNVVRIDDAARATTSVEVWERCKATVEGCDPAALTGDLARVFWTGRYAECASCGERIRDDRSAHGQWTHWDARGAWTIPADHAHAPVTA